MQLQYNQLDNDEIRDMISYCYNSDKDRILMVHVTGEMGLEYSIDRTTSDLIDNNIKTYELLDSNNNFIGYFGEEGVFGDRWFTGFFIMPEYRTDSIKDDVWNTIVNHFNGRFNVGVYNKNIPFKKFLIKYGCKLFFSAQAGEVYTFVRKG